MEFDPAKATVGYDVTHRIGEMIRSEQYRPGDRLPSERRLAEQLKVSRTSVREALRQLVTMGMLDSRPGMGTYVKEPASGVLLANLNPHLLVGPATMMELFEVREMIEVEAAARAAERATAAQIATMQRWAEAVEVCIARNDHTGRIVADVEFHREIVLATGNQVLLNLVDSLAGLLREMRAASLSIPEMLPKTIAAHRAIAAAIVARDSQAARQAMQEHLSTVRELTEAAFQSQPVSDQPDQS